MREYKIIKTEIFGEKKVTEVPMHYTLFAEEVYKDIAKNKLYNTRLEKNGKIIKANYPV